MEKVHTIEKDIAPEHARQIKMEILKCEVDKFQPDDLMAFNGIAGVRRRSCSGRRTDWRLTLRGGRHRSRRGTRHRGRW